MSPRPDHGEESYKGSGKLINRKALITSGDSGIGRAVAIAFIGTGAGGATLAHRLAPSSKKDISQLKNDWQLEPILSGMNNLRKLND